MGIFSKDKPVDNQMSLKDLTAKMLEGKLNTPVTPVTVSLPNPVEINPHAQAVVEEKPIEVPVVIDIPTNEPQVPEISAHENISENLDSMSGRELVSVFLSEVNDLLAAGKQMSDFQNQRDLKSSENKTEKDKIDTLRLDGKQIKETLESFLMANDNENPKDKLSKVLKAYDEYLVSFETEAMKIADVNRSADNKLLLQIRQKQTEIKHISEAIGGQDNFEKIRRFIRSCENKAAAFLTGEYGNINPETKNMVVSTVMEFVSKDLVGSKMLAGAGDVMGILIRMFTKSDNK